MPTDAGDVERVPVRTYVPAYQRREWDREAERLDMSRAEYVRTTVQRGRREELLGDDSESGNGRSGGVNPGGDPLQERIIDVLRDAGPLDWDGVVAGVTGDVEDRIETALDDLQRANRVRYSGRESGYVLEDGD